MTTMLLIGVIAIGIGGMLFGFSSLVLNGNQQLEQRLVQLTQNGGRGVAREDNSNSVLLNPIDEGPTAAAVFANRFLNLEKLILQSGLKLEAGKLLFLSLAGGAGLALAVFLLSPLPALAPLAFLLAAAVPFGLITWKARQRMEKFGAQLPAALDLMAQALRAGQSLPAGIQLVGEQLPDPLGPEFYRAFEQQNLGIPLTDSLQDLTRRIDNLDLRFFVTAVALQRQTGGDLAEILDKISSLIRQRFQIKGQIQALTGEGRISGVVLLGLPPVLFLVMLRLNYAYVMQLFENPLGQKMLAGAIVMQLIGAFAIKKIIDIKV